MLDFIVMKINKVNREKGYCMRDTGHQKKQFLTEEYLAGFTIVQANKADKRQVELK